MQKARLKLAATAFLVVGVLTVMLVGPSLVPADPVQQALGGRLKPPGWIGPDGLSHLLGTDQLGRDVLARVIAGVRLSVLVAVLAILSSLAIGVPFGFVAAFYGGFPDKLLMRLTDAQLAFPVVLFAIVFATALGPSVSTLILVLALTAWTRHARVVYGVVRSLRSRDYVMAARALGASDLRIVLRHMLPNTWPPIIVVSAFLVGRMVLLEAGLSFLGVGVPPPTPSLGSILSDGQDWIWVAPWLSTYPGLVLAVVVLASNLLGDVLRSVSAGRRA